MVDESSNDINGSDQTRIVPINQGSSDTHPNRFALGVLPEGTQLGDRYRVIKCLRAHETERHGLYLCTDGDQQLVVKVYPLDIPIAAEVRAIIGRLQHPNVAACLNQFEDDGMLFDVIPYYPDGSVVDAYTQPESSLLEVDHELIINRFAPQMLKAIEYIHSAGLVHRDINPGNIMVSGSADERQFLLGDFDISSRYSAQSDQCFTSRTAGTWAYTAPEAFPRYQDENGSIGVKLSFAMDYYSLGVTMLEMACGTTSLHTSKLPDVYDFYLSGQQIDIPGDLPERLRILLQGLLIRDSEARWGSEQTSRWVNECNTEDDLDLIRESHQKMAAVPPSFTYGGHDVHSIEQLGQLVADDLDAAVVYLEHHDEIWSWLSGLDNNLAVQIRKRVDAAPFGGEMILACWLNREVRLQLAGHDIASIQQWIDVTYNNYGMTVTNDRLYRFIYWLFYHANGEPQIAKKLMPIANTREEIRLHEICWALNPRLPLVINQGRDAFTPEQFATLAYGEADDWQQGVATSYDDAMRIWQMGILDAWLRQTNHHELLQKSLELQKDNALWPVKGFEALLHIMNPNLPKPVVKLPSVNPLKVSYCDETVVKIACQTQGAGVPIIDLKSEAFDGLHIETTSVYERDSTLVITLHVEHGFEDKEFALRVKVISTNTQIEPRITIPFRLVNPNGNDQTVMAVSTLIGAGVLGLSRLVISALGYPHYYNAWSAATASTSYSINETFGTAFMMILVVVTGFYFQIARAKIERVELRLSEQDLRALHENETYVRYAGQNADIIVRYPYITLVILLTICGRYTLSLIDFLTSSVLISKLPFIMWTLWGAIIGACAGFWLVSPVRGRSQQRIRVIMTAIGVMVLLSLLVNLLIARFL